MSKPHFHPSNGGRLAVTALCFFAGACAPQPAGPPTALVANEPAEIDATAAPVPPPVEQLATSRVDDATGIGGRGQAAAPRLGAGDDRAAP
jgi:hypothetical protein